MALIFRVDIVSAEGSFYSGRAQRVVVPGEMGELGILARHAPLVARLKPGLVRVLARPEAEETFFISGGFLEALPHHVTVLADTGLRSSELDMEAALAAQARAAQVLAGCGRTDVDYKRHKAELDLSIQLVRCIERLQQARRR